MNVIVTGIPRAGTTLASAIIDGLDDTVCLNEPAWHNASAAKDATGFAQFIAEDFSKIRAHLLAGKSLPDRRGENGEAITNYFMRDERGQMQQMFVDYPLARTNLSTNFTLAIKHNGPYLAVLPELIASKEFKIIAVVRHPLPVIASWRKLDLPISRGDMPNAKPYWPELRTLLETPMDLLEKHVRLYDLMLERILENAPHIHVVFYESLIQTPKILAEILGKDYTKNNLIRAQKMVVDEKISEAIEHFSTFAKNYESFSLKRSL